MASKQEVETVRLRNINSGAVVSVVADKVDRLGSEWEPADEPAPAAKTPAKRVAAKKAATSKASI